MKSISLKIGFISLDHLRDWTGITRLIDQIAVEMTKRGHCVTIIAQEGKASSKVPIAARDYPHDLLMLDLNSERGRNEAREKIAASGLDICAASIGSTQLLYLPGMFYKSGIPYVLSEPADPKVFTFERWQPYDHYASLFAADAFTVLLADYLPFYPEVLRKKSTVIGNPAPPPANIDFTARRKKIISTIISVGRFNEADKRFSVLIRAFALLLKKFPNWRLKLVGDGAYREFYDIIVAQLGIKSKIDFTGAVNNPEIHYTNADIFCLPSFSAEGLPMVFLEAAAHALPFVGFRSCVASNALIQQDIGALTIQGGGGGEARSSGAGGGGAYVAYFEQGVIVAHSFGGGGNGSSFGGSIGGGGSMGGSSGAFGPYQGNGESPPHDVPDRATSGPGAPASAAGAFPGWVSVNTEKGRNNGGTQPTIDYGGNGGSAFVTANSDVFLNSLTLICGETGRDPGPTAIPGAGGAVSFDASNRRVDIKHITLNKNGDGFGYTQADNGGLSFAAGTLVARQGYSFKCSGDISINIDAFEFDLSGASNSSKLLEVHGILLDIGGKSITLSGTPGSLSNGNTITLIDNVTGGLTPVIVKLGSVDFEISLRSSMSGIALIATVIPTYPVTVSSVGAGATGDGYYVAGETVNISAGTPPAGQQFKAWTASPSVTFADPENEITTFIMPANAVTVTASFIVVDPNQKYNINIGTFTGGRVEADKSVAMADETVALTCIPDKGYELKEVTVTASTAVDIELSGTGNKRTFSMPAADATVTATFRAMTQDDIWNAALKLIEDTTFVLTQKQAPNADVARFPLATLINALLDSAGLNIQILPNYIFIYTFVPADSGSYDMPLGVNGSFEFRVTPPESRTSAYSKGIIIAEPTGNEPVEETGRALSLQAYVQNGILFINGLTPGAPWCIYNLSGKLLYAATTSGDKFPSNSPPLEGQGWLAGVVTIPLQERGIYIIVSGAQSIIVVN